MITIKDVAQKAGLSVSTVSRALNNLADVSPKARKSALAAAADLNYQPHAAARNLRRLEQGKNQLQYTIGLVLLDQTAYPADPYFAELLAAVDAALRKRNFNIRIFPCSRNGGIPRDIENGLVDGVLFQQSSGSLIPRINKLMPTVTIGGYYPADNTLSICADYKSGIAEAVAHLYGLEKKHLAVFCDHPKCPDGMLNFMDMIREGILQADNTSGSGTEKPAFYPIISTPADGYEAGRRLFSSNHIPDAIIASDGAMLGIYRAAFEAGLTIPDDVCCIGIDGMPASAYLSPPLTVCDSHIDTIADRAIEVLIEMVANGTRRQGMELIPMSFMVRESTDVRS